MGGGTGGTSGTAGTSGDAAADTEVGDAREDSSVDGPDAPTDGPAPDVLEGGMDGGHAGDSGGPPITETETCAAREDEARWTGRLLYADDNPGCAGHTPCFDGIGAAVSAAASGDTVLVLPGTYSGVELRQTAELRDLRLRALEGPDVTTITGYCMRVTGAEHGVGQIWIEGFTFRDCGASSSFVDTGWGVYVDSRYDVDVRIQDNVFTGAFGRGAVGLWSSTVGTRFHAVVARNRFLDHRGEKTALDVDLPSDSGEDYCIRVENNVFARNQWALGLFYTRFEDGAGKFEVANNTFFGSEAAVSLSRPAGTYTFVNNILSGNTSDFSVGAEVPDSHDVRHNLIGSGQFSGLNGNFAADPLFADAARGDFRLRGASPAADRGDLRGTALVDIAGAPRTAPPDLGAYERREPAGERLPGLVCGDGIVQNGPVATSEGTFVGFEACDDRNTRSGDGCSSLCQLEPAAPRGQIALADVTQLCVIRADRSLDCWGMDRASVPVGSFKQVALSGYHGCALRDDGTARCWATSTPDATFAPPGRFTQISGASSQTCGLRENGSITCWDDRAVTLEQAGPFARVDANRRVCGLSPAGNPTCFPPYPSFPSGPFLQLLPDINPGGCGLRPNGELACLPDSFFMDVAPQAALVQVQLHRSTRACGLRPDGRAVFWESIAGNPRLIDARRFIEVVPSFNFCCGLTADHRAWCSENSYGLPAE